MSVWQRHRDARKRHESKRIPSPEKSKRQRYPFAFRSSGLVFYPLGIVSSSATEFALGENLTLLNRYVLGRMLLAVITAGGYTFFACFSFHLGSPRFLRGSHNFCLSCGVLAAQVKPKLEQKRQQTISTFSHFPAAYRTR